MEDPQGGLWPPTHTQTRTEALTRVCDAEKSVRVWVGWVGGRWDGKGGVGRGGGAGGVGPTTIAAF